MDSRRRPTLGIAPGSRRCRRHKARPRNDRDTEPPVITINGESAAHIHVGDTYSDLGATVTDNVDHNLGVHTFVGSTPIEWAALDTSEPATYHINYVATDNAGNTSTSTRTVNIEALSIVPGSSSAGAPTASTADTSYTTPLSTEDQIKP